jgi:hypothetical protein
VGNSLLFPIALFLPLALSGREQTPLIPPTDIIVRRLTEARDENRNRLRPYEVLRQYKLFTKEAAINKSEVLAAIEYVPPNVEKFRIHKAEGTAFGEKIVRKILQNENQVIGSPTDTDISPRNYGFRFVREDNLKGSRCYVLEINPLRKDTNLLRGLIWVDANTYLLHRIDGEPAKEPSWWVRDIHVVLDFENVQGMWLQNALSSTANVRFLGRHSLTARDVEYKMGDIEAGLRSKSRQHE